MAQRVKSWKSLLKLANKDLANCGTELLVHDGITDDTYYINVIYTKVSAKGIQQWQVTDPFRYGKDIEVVDEDGLAALINDAWVHAKVRAKEVYHLKKQPKIKPEKGFKAIVAFGCGAAHRAADNDWEELADYYHNQDSQALGIRKFKTAAERNAYIMGMNDALGWEDVYVLDSKEVRSLSKHLDLSKLSAPTEC